MHFAFPTYKLLEMSVCGILSLSLCVSVSEVLSLFFIGRVSKQFFSAKNLTQFLFVFIVILVGWRYHDSVLHFFRQVICVVVALLQLLLVLFSTHLLSGLFV